MHDPVVPPNNGGAEPALFTPAAFVGTVHLFTSIEIRTHAAHLCSWAELLAWWPWGRLTDLPPITFKVEYDLGRRKGDRKMLKSNHSEAQIIAALKQLEGRTKHRRCGTGVRRLEAHHLRLEGEVRAWRSARHRK